MIESPSICELTTGYALSAIDVAFTKKGMKLSFTPCSFSTFSFIRSRSWLTADMSISLNVVSVAVELCESSRFSAIRLRRVDIFSRVSRSPVGAGAGARCGAGDVLDDIGLAHHAAASRAGDASEVDVLFGGDALRSRRRADRRLRGR